MEQTETQVVKFDVTEAAIAEMSSLYGDLVITDLDDQEQYDAVHSAHMVVRGKRIAVDKKRKELKADALAWGKKVQSEANRIFDLIAPLESHLKGEKQKVQDEKERIDKERITVIRRKIQAFNDAFHDLNGVGSVKHLESLISELMAVEIEPDEYFEFTQEAIDTRKQVLEQATQALETRKRLDAEEAERKAEAERLEKERAELEKLRKEQEERDRLEREKREAEVAKVKAENDRIAAEQKAAQDKIDEQNRKIQEERHAIEAEKKAALEQKDREEFERQAKIKAEADAKEATAQAERDRIATADAEAAEKARQEALKPDKQKIIEWVGEFNCENIPVPDVKDATIKAIVRDFEDELEALLQDALEKVEKL